jgi:DNA-binding Lrp family transcriptional regulator
MTMVSAYMFIKLAGGTPVETVAAIRKIKGIKQAHVVTGPDDIIAFVEAEDMNELGNITVAIRNIAVVTGSDTRVTWPI